MAQRPDIATVRQTYAALRVAWVELLADAEMLPDLVGRFEQLSDRVRERLWQLRTPRAEAERRAQALAREQADRAAVCAEVEALNGDDVLDRLAAARRRGKACRRCPRLGRRSAAAVRRRLPRGGARHERRLAARQLVGAAPAVVAQIEAVAANDRLRAIRAQWYAAKKQWQAITREGEVDPELIARYERASQALDARESEHREGRYAVQQENLHRLQALVQDLETRAAAENLTLKDAERILKDTKLAVGTMGPLPAKQDREDLTVRLQAVRAAVTPRIKELRDAEEWKRWANVQVQEELCAKMEALIPIADAEPESGQRDAHAAGAVEEGRRRAAIAGRGALDPLQDRAGSGLREVQGLLCAAGGRASGEPEEEGSSVRAGRGACRFDRLGRTADAIKALQAEWKTIGP